MDLIVSVPELSYLLSVESTLQYTYPASYRGHVLLHVCCSTKGNNSPVLTIVAFGAKELHQMNKNKCPEGHEYPRPAPFLNYKIFKVNDNDIRQDIVYNVSL